MMLVQTLWCGLLLTLGLGSMHNASDATEARGPYWLGALLFGLAWMQAAHWAVSWGNVLGLLPVMGQPMTWLSSGNSHMLALAASSLVLGMIGAWVEAEK